MYIEESVKGSLRYLAKQLSKDEKTIEQATDRMIEIIDKKFNEKYDALFNDAVKEKQVELEKRFEELKADRLESARVALDREKERFNEKFKVLSERESEVESMRMQLLQQDPKYFTAKYACEIAAAAAGIDIETDIDREHYSEFTETPMPFKLYGDNTSDFRYSRKSKSKNKEYGNATEYTKQQLIRTIGVIWAAALGMQAIGGSVLDNEKKEQKDVKNS